MTPASPTFRESTWTLTVAFWATLLVAAALYAAVTLAPKFAVLEALRLRYTENQLRLVELERQANELERVATALRSDERFAAEMAKLDYTLPQPAEEHIAVSAELRLGADRNSPAIAEKVIPAASPVSLAVVHLLATHPGLRQGLLMTACVLLLGAFLLLHEGQAATVRAVLRMLRRGRLSLRARYRA